jgi:hypothetical protein
MLMTPSKSSKKSRFENVADCTHSKNPALYNPARWFGEVIGERRAIGFILVQADVEKRV